MSNINTPVGAFSPYSCKISAEARQAFDEADKGIGVEYSPVAVSEQVVSGMNYKFFCNARIVNGQGYNEAAIVSIYKSLEGPAIVTGKRMVD